jgi:histidinol dehydrogenase
MKIIQYPSPKDWKQILQRPVFDSSALQQQVKTVMNEVKQNGDDAIRKFTQQFDGVVLENSSVSEKEISESAALLSDELKEAIQLAAKNIRSFHEKYWY